MSLKSAKSEKKTPRAMPVEAIVTRFKSAQLKRLVDKDQTKNTMKTKRKTKKLSTNIKSPVKKLVQHKIMENFDKTITRSKENNEEVTVENKEYCPNKLKRKILNARIFLAPKHSFKIICGTKSCNKRKLHIPQRDAKYIKESQNLNSHNNEVESHKSKSSSSAEMTIAELVRIVEENGNLDDEDLLEILTCPSPVWWEEPPDGYVEEAIITQPTIQAENIGKKQIKHTNKHSELTKNQREENNLSENMKIDINNRDTSFIRKRCKLEALLGDIKNKVNRNNSSTEESDRHIKELEGKKERKDKVKTNSECAEEDLSEFNDDDILEHLENLEIPVEAGLKKETLTDDTLRRYSTESDMTEEYLDLSLLEECDREDFDRLEEVKIEESINLIDLESDESYTETNEITDIEKDRFNDETIDKTRQNEFVTVYKILNNDEKESKIDKKKKKDNKINSYYKQKKVCKTKASLNTSKTDPKSDLNHVEKSIVISESDKIKYCFICSSIFDTEKCSYCSRKALKRKNSDGNKEAYDNKQDSSEND